MIIFAKDFLSKSSRDGPSTSIVNLNYRNITIFNSIYQFKNDYFSKYNNNKIFFIRGLLGLFFKLKLIYKNLKREKLIEFHCVYDIYGCLIPLILLLTINYKNKNVRIYPRGMINKNVLFKKRLRRIIYLSLIKLLIKKIGIELIATSKYERGQLYNFYDKDISVKIKPNKTKFRKKKFKSVLKKKKNLKILFFSNITWKKNFRLFYEIINELNYPVEIEIMGSVFIRQKSFDNMLNRLKKRHLVSFLGHIENKKIEKIILRNHLLFLPTYDENFGHVIVENFFLSRPCILSSNTPWNDNIFYDAGFSIPLSEKQTFKNALDYFYHLDQFNYNTICKRSKKYIENKINNENY